VAHIEKKWPFDGKKVIPMSAQKIVGEWADPSLLYFYRNTPMLASGIKGMRIQLRFGSA
jgi:hypothetical protein